MIKNAFHWLVWIVSYDNEHIVDGNQWPLLIFKAVVLEGNLEM